MSRAKNSMNEGVDPRLLARSTHPLKQFEGKWCRDRLPWGGFNVPDSCDCVGTCKADARGDSA